MTSERMTSKIRISSRLRHAGWIENARSEEPKIDYEKLFALMGSS
jgi:hypothetical protein